MLRCYKVSRGPTCPSLVGYEPATYTCCQPFLRNGIVPFQPSALEHQAIKAVRPPGSKAHLSLDHGSRQPSRKCNLCTPRRLGKTVAGLALFSTGTLWVKKDEEDADSNGSPNTSGPANTTRCIFERNRASDGGGMYSSAGYDIVHDSRFEGNVAGDLKFDGPS